MSGENLTVEQVNAITGDDIAYWIGNPFMTPDLLIAKVCWWMTRAATPTPVPSEVAETTAGEHHPACYQSTGVPDHLPAGLCDCKVLRMLDAAENTTGERDRTFLLPDDCDCLPPYADCTHGPAEPDAGEVEALARVLADLPTDPEHYARLILATDWLAALLDRVRREEGERIAQAIEADRPEMGLHINVTEYRRGMDDGLTKAARIARAASAGRGEGL